MGQSYIRDSRFQLNCLETRFYIENVPRQDLIKLGLCDICAQLLKGEGARCSGITNGVPYITMPTNMVDKYTRSTLDGIRKCSVI